METLQPTEVSLTIYPDMAKHLAMIFGGVSMDNEVSAGFSREERLLAGINFRKLYRLLPAEDKKEVQMLLTEIKANPKDFNERADRFLKFISEEGDSD